MTTVYLGRSDSDFWEMTFRQIIALIDQWREIEKGRDMMRAYINAGGDPGNIVDEKKARQIEYEMGAAMW